MHPIKNQISTIPGACRRRKQNGFSLVEVLISMTVMLIVVGAIFSLMRSSMKIAMTTYEMTDAQENLRTAQEFINRDVLNAGDGLKSISTVRVPKFFVTNYVTLNPVPTPSPAAATVLKLAIFTSDNNVPVDTVVNGGDPGTKLRAGTDRQTILQLDPDFRPFGPANPLSAITPTAINGTGSTVTLPDTADMTAYAKGETYFLSSGVNGTFATVTAIKASLPKQLTFSDAIAADNPYQFNLVGLGGHIWTISNGGLLSTSLQRMRIIQYYVTDAGLLMRRVFGVQGGNGAGFREGVVAEHVVNVQFNYSLIPEDPITGVITPTSTLVLATSEQQLAVRQVEVTVIVETPHAVTNGARQQLTMTTATSVRNMQFRNAL
jgi:prepilin-type N-terminal cleavage/methylation domain-containing protein